ncbi:cold-shock protein [Litorimonas sp. RW-G-Af-16]|uniref:cold-shock protein n=1 Tax=Litorimonas sp. RW-G-Af-16 TaxID=3241168 RepID=UPI00390C5B58
MKAGTVKFFNTTKGFGFIAAEDGSGDVFVHITALQKAGLAGLNEGDKVEFNTAINERTGRAAVENINMA